MSIGYVSDERYVALSNVTVEFERPTPFKTWIDERGGQFAYLGGNGLAAEVDVLSVGSITDPAALLIGDDVSTITRAVLDRFVGGASGE